MADDGSALNINVIPTLDYKPFERSFREFRQRIDKQFQTKKSQPGVMEAMFFPKGSARTAVASSVGKNMKSLTAEFSKGLKGLGTDSSVKRGFTSIEAGFQKIQKSAMAATIAVQKLNAAVSGAGAGKGGAGGAAPPPGRGGAPGAASGGGAGGGAPDKGKATWWDKAKGKWYTRAAAFGGGAVTKGLWQFATEAYGEGIRSYEARETARLNASPAIMGLNRKRMGRYAGGTRLGFTSAEVPAIQAAGATAGLGRGIVGGKTSMELTRALGAEGVEFGGGIMRRGGLGGATGAAQMFKTLSKAFTVAVKTGLDEARVPEFLSAANKYAEEQIAITPDKDAFRGYARELALVQGGGAGLRGKYGAAALGQVDKAMKGAQGVQQAFLMRSFGFGKGAGFMDVLQRQEQGIAGRGAGGESNVMAVMKQLQQEYGAGKYGGLSQQGLMAFKGMGFGSTFMGQKFGEIYLQQKSGKISPEEAQKKVNDIMAQESEKGMPRIQKRAYEAMSSFGRVATTLAERFSKMAGLGEKWFGLKKSLNDIQIVLANTVSPLIMGVGKGLKSLVPFIKKWGPKVGSVLESLVSGISGLVGKISEAIVALKVLISRMPKWLGGGGGVSENIGGMFSKDVIKNMDRATFSEKSLRSLAGSASGRERLKSIAEADSKKVSGYISGIKEGSISDMGFVKGFFTDKSKATKENVGAALGAYQKLLEVLSKIESSSTKTGKEQLEVMHGLLVRLQKLGVRVTLVTPASSQGRRANPGRTPR